jgi:hypothetical protein
MPVMQLAFGRAVSAADLDATMNQRKESQGMRSLLPCY